MADSKLTALTAETTVAMTDITYFVDDPSGTPLSRKCTIANLSKGIDMTNVPTASGAITITPLSGQSLNVGLATTGDFKINTDDLVVDTSTSFVGINTAAPEYMLDIGAGSPSYTNAIRVGFALILGHAGTGYDIIGYNFKPTAVTDSYVYDNTDVASALRFQLGGFQFFTAPSGTEGAAITATERFTILQAGNVGVGEESPDYKLDVNGSFGFTPGTSVTPVDNGDVVIEFTNNTTLTFRGKGSDGTVRSGTVTLA